MKVTPEYGSRVWFRLLLRRHPGMRVLGVHDGFVVVRHQGDVWKVIGGSPLKPTLRQVISHDFLRPA